MFNLAWLVLLLPLSAFIITSFFTRKSDRISAGVSLSAISASLVLSIIIFLRMISAPGNYEFSFPWLSFVKNLNIELGVLLNPLSSVMLLVVCAVSFLVQVYSIGYMKGDPGYRKFMDFCLYSVSPC